MSDSQGVTQVYYAWPNRQLMPMQYRCEGRMDTLDVVKSKV